MTLYSCRVSPGLYSAVQLSVSAPVSAEYCCVQQQLDLRGYAAQRLRLCTERGTHAPFCSVCFWQRLVVFCLHTHGSSRLIQDSIACSGTRYLSVVAELESAEACTDACSLPALRLLVIDARGASQSSQRSLRLKV